MSNNYAERLHVMIKAAQEHSDQLLVALDALKGMARELNDKNCEAGAFLQMIITHEEYYSEHFQSGIQAISSIPSIKQAA